MVKYIGRLGAALAVTAMLAACGGKGESASADSSAAKDLQMAGDSAAAQPSLADTAAAPASAPARVRPSAAAPTRRAEGASRPAEAPKSEPARPAGEIAAGETLLLHPSQKVCTNTNKVGDVVQATVAAAVPGSNGVSIPAGAVVRLTITALKRSENVKDPIDMGFRVESVTFAGQTYAMSATVTAEAIDHVRNEPTSKDVQKVVGGALVGAIAGKLIGKSTTGAVVGGAAGAAAGAGVAATTANFEGCIAEGSDMTVKLTAPVVIK
ncbi:MAG: hypothetical protein WBQ26_04970 [Gemmatimonadaceae bacterium]|nr:hypothetical protein [Gemmatimonadaceae bacterium]